MIRIGTGHKLVCGEQTEGLWFHRDDRDVGKVTVAVLMLRVELA